MKVPERKTKNEATPFDVACGFVMLGSGFVLLSACLVGSFPVAIISFSIMVATFLINTIAHWQEKNANQGCWGFFGRSAKSSIEEDENPLQISNVSTH